MNRLYPRLAFHALVGDAKLAASDEFRKLSADYLDVVKKIGSGKIPAAAKSRLGKLADLYPGMRRYFETLPDRTEDFSS